MPATMCTCGVPGAALWSKYLLVGTGDFVLDMLTFTFSEPVVAGAHTDWALSGTMVL